MVVETLLFLLPVAAFSGWLVGRRAQSVKAERSGTDIPSDYLKGMNYLLNEQPDKAIETFIQMLDVDSNTVETHLALGGLFRRRGEVDRAIRIHQNLIARPTLNKNERNQALFELGQDYMRAGLLDRAETLLSELADTDHRHRSALKLLMDIYQQEKEWQNAIQIAKKYELRTGENLSTNIAHFYCELAEQVRAEGEPLRALKLLKRALAEERSCVRASLLEADIELTAGDAKSALRAAQRVEQQDADFIPEALPLIKCCYQTLGRDDEFRRYLQRLLADHSCIAVVLELALLIYDAQGSEASEEFVTDFLKHTPSVFGIERLIDLNLERVKDEVKDKLLVLKKVTGGILKNKPLYQCKHCGFNGRTLYWQCPGCKCWNTVKPVQGTEGK
ncbi:Lipopolysaccharide assembly protein LapB [hydrothermal vent metagenome]|uniref:Lipopolysaccharide assembly protein LapB n=1 Tax=hydrothermal vent metagenome TaxID=652676 RepID=A0A3B1C5X4_9ZZZZ